VYNVWSWKRPNDLISEHGCDDMNFGRIDEVETSAFV
jgi:hypothetical protein